MEHLVQTTPAFAAELINAMADGVSVVDGTGRHVLVNESFCEMTGFSREELLDCEPFQYPYWPSEEYDVIFDDSVLAGCIEDQGCGDLPTGATDPSGHEVMLLWYFDL